MQLLSKLEYYKCLPEDKASSKRLKILEKPIQQTAVADLSAEQKQVVPPADTVQSKRVLGLFCTDATGSPNVRPELEQLAKQMQVKRLSDAVLLELRPEAAEVRQGEHCKILWQASLDHLQKELLSFRPHVLHI